MLKKEILHELEELLDIPQFERIIFHKVEELKSYFEDEIDYYMDLRESFRKKAYGKMRVLGSAAEIEEDNREETNRDTYFFELRKGKDCRWSASNIEPPAPPGYSIDDIIPDEIVQHIVSLNPSPRKIETITNLSPQKAEGIKYNLEFIKYSNFHILGSLQRQRDELYKRHENANMNANSSQTKGSGVKKS
jgi:hypothetical protein